MTLIRIALVEGRFLRFALDKDDSGEFWYGGSPWTPVDSIHEEPGTLSIRYSDGRRRIIPWGRIHEVEQFNVDETFFDDEFSGPSAPLGGPDAAARDSVPLPLSPAAATSTRTLYASAAPAGDLGGGGRD